MAKQASYFSHDSNARSDAKIIRLRKKHGMEGYGIYFVILERMRDDAEYKAYVEDYDAIAYECQVETETVRSVVEDFGLFDSDGEYFWSNSFLERMEIKDEKRRKKSEAGKLGSQKRWGNPTESEKKAESEDKAPF